MWKKKNELQNNWHALRIWYSSLLYIYIYIIYLIFLLLNQYFVYYSLPFIQHFIQIPISFHIQIKSDKPILGFQLLTDEAYTSSVVFPKISSSDRRKPPPLRWPPTAPSLPPPPLEPPPISNLSPVPNSVSETASPLALHGGSCSISTPSLSLATSATLSLASEPTSPTSVWITSWSSS